MNKQIIGIAGRIKSGKSTVAEYIQNYQNEDYTEYSMAQPLKQIGEIFHFKDHQLYGTQEEKLEIHNYWGISGREFLQKFGTDICRNLLKEKIPNMKINRSIWVELFHLERLKNPLKKYVISDVRFIDEANYILENGGIIIKLDRLTKNELTEELRPLDNSNKLNHHSQHASEMQVNLLPASFTINNNGTLDELYSSIDYILQSD